MIRTMATVVLVHAIAAGIACGALAQHLDIAVQENTSDGRMSVHGFDFNVLPQFGFVVDKRTFGRSFGISGFSLLTDDPGFVSRVNPTELNPPGLLAVPGSEPLRFNILAAPADLLELGGRNLSYWDGSGTVVWSAVPDTEMVSIFKGSIIAPDDESIADGSTSDVPGYVIGGTDAVTGSLHEHIKFLMLPDGLVSPPVGPNHGVYLLLLELRYDPYGEHVPVWVALKVFAGGQSTLDAAVADVETRFQSPLCSDGIDNDKDGYLDDADPGCTDPLDMSERGGTLVCDDGIDNDSDGEVDFPNDPGCRSLASVREDPACDDDLDNDNDGGTDWDGGVGGGAIDPQCANKPWRTIERNSSACGLGFEAAVVLLPLALLRARRRRA